MRHREVLEGWVRGWALSRRTPAPVVEHDGFRIDVGAPNHRVRYVLSSTRGVRGRGRTVADPGTWLKVCGSRATVVNALPPTTSSAGSTEYLMWCSLVDPAVGATPPPSCTVVVADGDPVWTVTVLADDGTPAATGQLAVSGQVAVVDQVVTDPEQRRRGLASVVMARLGALALGAGASVGALLATEPGRSLYRALWWDVVSEVVPAHVPGPTG